MTKYVMNMMKVSQFDILKRNLLSLFNHGFGVEDIALWYF